MSDLAPYSPPDPPKPVLLRRVGNLIEANLLRAHLETAGIPSFLGEQDVFSGGAIHAGSRHGVEIYVPADLLSEALEVIDIPPELPENFEPEPFFEDPGRSLSFRALVAGVIGWLVIVLHPIGAFLAILIQLYTLYLAIAAVRFAIESDLRLRLRVVVACALALGAIAISIILLISVFGRA